MTLEDESATALFTLQPGEHAQFEFGSVDDAHIEALTTEHCFEETLNYWRRWSAHSNYQGRWREMVQRSALVLKLLTSHQHGSIAAAATFACLKSWAANATGTIAPPGSVTPRSACMP